MKNNIRWYRALYIGGANGKEQKIFECLKDGKIHPGLYLLVLPSNRSNLLDILPHPVLMQEHYKKIPLYVVGVCRGRRESMELAGKILAEAYRCTGNIRLEGFLGDDFTEEPQMERGPLYRKW